MLRSCQLSARSAEIAFLHLEGDWYYSTRDVFHNLFDAVSRGTSLQVDDYRYWMAAGVQIAEFQQEQRLSSKLSKSMALEYDF